MSERLRDLGGRREARADAGHDLESDAGGAQRVDFFLGAPEQHRIAALETHDHCVLARRAHQKAIDDRLIGRGTACPLADRQLAGAGRKGEHLVRHQRIVQHEIRFGEKARRLQRQQISRSRPRADEIDGSGHHAASRIMPAAAVWLETGSISTKAPVAGRAP